MKTDIKTANTLRGPIVCNFFTTIDEAVIGYNAENPAPVARFSKLDAAARPELCVIIAEAPNGDRFYRLEYSAHPTFTSFFPRDLHNLATLWNEDFTTLLEPVTDESGYAYSVVGYRRDVEAWKAMPKVDGAPFDLTDEDFKEATR